MATDKDQPDKHKKRRGKVITRILLVVAAIPFGCVLGVLIARVVAGRDFGQLPLMTVPIGIGASIAFAIWITS